MSTPLVSPRDVAACLMFFTRLPVPSQELGERPLAASIWAAPFAGVVVALCAALAYALASALGLAAGPAAALALGAGILASGALHEDGLADTADGFGGGRSKERVLEIMRDSRIGSYGALALGLSLLLRWTALAGLSGTWTVLAALVAAHAASRALLPAFMALLPPARADGLGAGAGTVRQEAALLAVALGAIPLLLLGFGGFVAAILLLAALFFAFRALCLRKIGGQTGDTLGALQQAAEILVLLVASVALT